MYKINNFLKRFLVNLHYLRHTILLVIMIAVFLFTVFDKNKFVRKIIKNLMKYKQEPIENKN